MPHRAHALLRIDPSKRTVEILGSIHSPKGRDNMYRGGTLGLDGDIYAIPSDATAVLRIKTKEYAMDRL